jgi:hypothetical protein
MAAKLAISTISDVRNTMFMSGLTPFPRAHWATLAPAMMRNAEIHAVIAGHRLRGPFKHYWGEASRWVGEDNPYSLFLAAGIPFEVTETPASDGWTFLSDFDARAIAASGPKPSGTHLIQRTGAGNPHPDSRAVPETLDALFALKREIAPQLAGVPYVEEDLPVACAWYPTARAVLLWNLADEPAAFTVRAGTTRHTVSVDGLDIAVVRDVQVL